MTTEAKLRRLFIEAGLRGPRLTEAIISTKERRKHFDEGVEAYDNGSTLESCPHEHDSPEQEFWHDGWRGRQAFCQGQYCKRRSGNLDDNPYAPTTGEMYMDQLTLEALWKEGFQSE